MGGFSKKDASRATGDSTKMVSQAWHDARDAASATGQLVERGVSKLADGGAVSWALHTVFKAVGMIGGGKK